MRIVLLLLFGSLAFARAALARGVVNPTNAESGARDLSSINFNLAAPDYGKVERLPEAPTLRDLSAGGGKPAATTESKTPSKTAQRHVVKPMPKPKPAANATWQGKPMSAWRRAYIARHGHQPPVPAK